MMSKRSPSRTIESFEIESGSNENDYNRPQSSINVSVEDGFASAFGRPPKRREHKIFEQQPSMSKAKKLAILRYVGLSTMAVIASVICPGKTLIWRDSSSFQYYSLKIMGIYVIVMISFFTLQDSDPGFLTPTILEQSIDGTEALLSKDADDTNDDAGRAAEEDVEGSNKVDENADIESSMKETSSALHTSTLDPTPNATSDPLAAPFNKKKSSTEEEFGAFGVSSAPLALKHRKVCVLCAIPKPPLRSHHCKICGKCVATFDHHCGFLATCIGERNHFRFWIFVGLNVVSIRICCEIVNSSSYGVTTMLFKGQGDDHDDNKLILLSFVVVLTKIYFYLVWLVAHLLFGIHTYLILANKTTFEMNIGKNLDYMRDTKPMDCIFSKGCFENVRIRCFLDAMCSISILWSIRRCCDFPLGSYQLIRRSKEDDDGSREPWSPMLWKREEKIIRDSEDWWNHPWQNKYWQCC